MYKFTRNFTITGLAGAVIASFLFSYVWQQYTLSNLIAMEKNESENLARHLINTKWKELSPWLSEIQTLKRNELYQHAAIKDFGISVRSGFSGLDILNIRIHAPNGITVFSTEQRHIGMTSDSPADIRQARKGKPVARMVYRNVINSLDGMILEKHTLVSFIPIRTFDGEGVEAVMEMHLDISDSIDVFQRSETMVFVFIAVVLLIIFVALFFVVRKAGFLLHRNDEKIKQQIRQLAHRKNHDQLTDLPGRELFYQYLKQSMKVVEENEKLLGVLYLELGRFKKVNDTVGYTIGDKLLLEASTRIMQSIGKYDVVSRLGGYDFVILMKSVSDVDEIEHAADRILAEISSQFNIEGYDLYLSPSIGISIYPFSDDDEHGLIKKANAAMYKAKSSGRNTWLIYSPTISLKATTRFSLESALRHALMRNEFELHYQPVVLAKTGKVFAVEALIRWRSPELGLVAPNDFIPLLEDTGLIVSVGRWVLETACLQGAKWHEQGLTDLKINVNVSAVQFLQREVTRQVSDALELSGMKPHLLDLEITESLLIDNITYTIETLEILNDYGVSLSVDDFGTGYSSLEYLKLLPVDTLKIDRSFVRDVVENVDDGAIVKAICTLASNMRFKTIAEGVETTGQLNYLRGLNVTGIQGYLFCRPMPADELNDFLMKDGLQDGLQSIGGPTA